MDKNFSVTPDSPSGRLAELDVLRGSALLLGIVLHGLLAFAPGEMWLVNDRYHATWVVVVIGPIHMFRMALFLFLSGYLARRSLSRRSTADFLRDRVKRILLPLIVFIPIVVFPLGLIAMADAWRRGVTLPDPPKVDALGIPTGQLWFLLVLFECLILAVAIKQLARIAGAQTAVKNLTKRLIRWLSSPGGILLAAVPYSCAMWLQGSVSGIVEPFGLVPEPAGLVGYFGAFVVGWLFSSDPEAVDRLANRWSGYLVAAVISSAVVTILTLRGDPWPLGMQLLFGIGGWCWVYGLVGLGRAHLGTPRPWVRYLADSSYWLYLLHLPLLLSLELLIADLTWPIGMKIVVVWLPSLTIMLLSYDLLVRSTWLGGWLNGRRYPRFLTRVMGGRNGQNRTEFHRAGKT